jgi:hypothetical protein
MIIKQICSVKDNRLIINLPKTFKEGKQVLVIIDDDLNLRADKIALMQKASSDPLYLADLAEIEEDFDFADSEEK